MKKLLPYIIITAIIYNLLPLICFIPALRYDISLFILLLFLIYPGNALICGLIYGIKHGFSLFLILFTAILFVPAMFIFFNSSAWVYMIPYTLLTFIGLLIGTLIHKKRNGKYRQGQ